MNFIKRAAELISGKMQSKGWRHVVTCMAAVVVFGTTYALILPALTLEGKHPVLTADTLSAWSGEELEMKVHAEVPDGQSETTFVLTMKGDKAGLSSDYVFDADGVTVVTDETGAEIELHRTVRENATDTVDYWFTMSQGESTDLTLSLQDEVDVADLVKNSYLFKDAAAEDNVVIETASDSNAVKVETVAAETSTEEIVTASDSDAVKTEVSETASSSDAIPTEVSDVVASDSNAAGDNVSVIATDSNATVEVEENENGFVEILDGAVINDLEQDEEDAEASEITANVLVNAGFGRNLDEAIKDADKNADKRGDASLYFRWKSVTENAYELTWSGNGAKVTLYYDAEAQIPENAELSVRELEQGSDEYNEYLEHAKNAVNAGSDAAMNIGFARFFDITILSDGQEIEPASPVNVVINYDDRVNVAPEEELNVVHFADQGTELLKPAAAGVDNGNANSIDVISFTQDSFSVTGTVVARKSLAGEITSQGQTYTVTLTYDDDAQIPEGAVLKVNELEENSAEYQESYEKTVDALAETEKPAISAVRFFDITIMNGETEVEPAAPVQVSISLKEDTLPAADDAAVKAVHIDDAGSTEVIDVTAVKSGDEVSKVNFEASGFSVYAIVSTTQSNPDTVSTEFRFYTKDSNGNDVPYNYVVKAADGSKNTKTSVQYVTNNGTLYNPGIPTENVPEGEGKKFTGWADASGTMVLAGTENRTYGENEITSFTTVNLYPVYSEVRYLEYHDEKDVIYKVVETTDNPAVLRRDKVNEVTYTADSANKAFLGWSTEKDQTALTNVLDTVTFADGTNRIVLYPVIADVYWVNFDKNDWVESKDADGNTVKVGSGAEYAAPIYVLQGYNVKTSEKTLPTITRPGYTFAGWYTEADGGTEFTDTTPVSSDVTVYAHWTPAEVNYRINYWVQNPNDDVKKSLDSEKTYDYVTSVVKTAVTGSSVSLSTGDKAWSVYQNANPDKFQDTSQRTRSSYFYLSENKTGTDEVTIPGMTTSQSVTVAADGSTTLNVYYNRYTIEYWFCTHKTGTIQKWVDGYWNETGHYEQEEVWKRGHYEYKNVWVVDSKEWVEGHYDTVTTDWAPLITLSGLYEKNLPDSEWPYTDAAGNKTYWQEYNSGSWTTFLSVYGPDDDTFSDAKISTDTTNHIATFAWKKIDSDQSGGHHFYHIRQLSDGTWPQSVDDSDNVTTIGTTASGFTMNDKFDGFSLTYYNDDSKTFGYEGFCKDPVAETKISKYSSASPGVKFTTNLYMYYVRHQNPLQFYDYFNGGISAAPIAEKSVYFDKPLTEYEKTVTVSADNKTLSYGNVAVSHEGYEFAGWYSAPTDDLNSNTLFDFTKSMPDATTCVYAIWTPVKNRVWIQPNGGIIDPDGTESTYFNASWNETIKEYTDVEETGRNYIEDANGTYAYVIFDRSGTRKAYYKEVTDLTADEAANALKKNGSIIKYKESEGAYEFVGWFKVLKTIDTDTPPDILDSDSLEPWNFNTPITEPTAIRAIWKRNGLFKVTYDATDLGTTTNEDTDYVYGDLSQGTVGSAATPNAGSGYYFVGWRTPTGELLKPGELFTIYSAYATPIEGEKQQFKYTLTAEYQKFGETSITYDPNGGTINSADVTEATYGAPADNTAFTTELGADNAYAKISGLVRNAAVTLSDGTGFERAGYYLKEWNTKADGTGTAYTPGAVFGADDDSNTLYAIWDTLTFDLEFTKLGENADGGDAAALPGAVFSLYTSEDCTGGPVTGAGNIVSGSNGIVSFTGISSCGYAKLYLKEEAAPAGYIADSTIHEITFERRDPAVDGKAPCYGVIDGDTDKTTLLNTLKHSDVKIVKQDSNGNALKGAVFTLSRKNSSGNYETYGADDGKIDMRTVSISEVTKSLPDGCYQLTETQAPDGYIIETGSIYFKVSADAETAAEKLVFANEDGNTTDESGNAVTYANASVNTSTELMQVIVKNKAGQELPHTGGSGTKRYTFCGLLLIMAAALMYGFSKRRTVRRARR